jgi:hypothetical protein
VDRPRSGGFQDQARMGIFVLPLAPVVPVLGYHGRPLYFHGLRWPWSSLIWVPSMALTLRRASVDRPRSGGFQDQARMGIFVLPLAPVVPVLGYHGRPLCFHGLSLILGFVLPLNLGIILVHSGYGWRVWQVAPVFPLHGGLLIRSESSFSATNSSGEGDPTGEVPLSGRDSPATQADTLEVDGDNGNGNGNGAKDGTSSDRCSSGSGAVWVFCLASGGLSGVIWTPFERKVFLRDAPGLPLAPPWGLGASGPCVGAADGLCFSLS